MLLPGTSLNQSRMYVNLKFRRAVQSRQSRKEPCYKENRVCRRYEIVTIYLVRFFFEWISGEISIVPGILYCFPSRLMSICTCPEIFVRIIPG